MSHCHVEVVRDPQRLADLLPALRDLFARDARATPFQSPDWFVPWAQAFAADHELRVIVASAEGSALVCLPLALATRAGRRTLCWLGSGISDYLDVLLDRERGRSAWPGALAALHDLMLEAERMELSDLPEASALLEPLASVAGVVGNCAVCPRLVLPASPEEYIAALPRWLRRNVRRTESELARWGQLVWRTASAGDTPELLEHFFELHTARWRNKGEPGALADVRVRDFHRSAAPHLVAQGLLELCVLFVGEQAVAASYVLTRSDACLYQFGYAPAWSKLSLGSLLIQHSILRAIQHGRAAYDFLRGSERYKYDWGAADTSTYELVREQQRARLRRRALGSSP
jgi:CelD/BcsL family acetyltransferase involved in cellulose biosynthesis